MSKKKKQQRTQAAQSAGGSTKSSKSRRQEQRVKRQQKQRSRTIGLVALVVILAATAVGVFVLQRGGSTASANALQLDDPALGPETVPVTIVEYGDFGCPACRSWHKAGILEAIMAQYGDQVRFVWKDYPVITPQSPKAAEAAQCASAQGKFWEYHDHLYDNASNLRIDDLKRYAAAVGLDQAAFSECLDGGQAKSKVQENLQEGRRLHVRGTPSFTVNGELLPGPPSFQQLEQLILAELS